jgi:acyl-coenzyme A synthetase/AMP-(fatty) acid ligase
MAMTNLLVALASGAALHLSAALGDRVRPLRFMERVEATHLRVAPRFIDLAVAERRDPPASLRVWGSGGDRLHVSHVERVFDLGVPSVVNTYGTSESMGFASSARLERGTDVHSLNGTVTIGTGGVGPWRTVVAGVGDHPMLAIQTPHLPAGYLFGTGGEYPRWHASDTLLTGDAGAEVGGDLFCLGRSGRRVKRHGRFVDLDEVDAALRSHRDVASYTVVTTEGELLCLVETGDEEARALHRGLPAVLRPEILPDRLVPVRKIPRLGNGKIDQARAGALAIGEGVS